MLLMLGTSLAELRITSYLWPFALSFVRVFGGLAVGLGVASLLRLSPIAAGTLAIQCAMPVAIPTHLLAQKYGGPSREIAGMILISTGLALASLPVVLRLVR